MLMRVKNGARSLLSFAVIVGAPFILASQQRLSGVAYAQNSEPVGTNNTTKSAPPQGSGNAPVTGSQSGEGSTGNSSQQQPGLDSTSGGGGQKSDNSIINRRDHSSANPTAEQQGNSKLDIDTTSKIRRALTDEKALSTYAHNVKIISQNGSVVLRGPVRSTDEKKMVEKIAVQVAGAEKVKNELDVVQ